jgi:hypothetical protein
MKGIEPMLKKPPKKTPFVFKRKARAAEMSPQEAALSRELATAKVKIATLEDALDKREDDKVDQMAATRFRNEVKRRLKPLVDLYAEAVAAGFVINVSFATDQDGRQSVKDVAIFKAL